MNFEWEIKRSKGISSSIDLKIITQIISQHQTEGCELLDIGCGKGDLITSIRKHIAGDYHIDGMDLHIYEGIQSRIRYFYQQNLNLDFSNIKGRYDIIIVSHVILYLENLHHFFREINHILKDRGTLIIANPNPSSIRSMICFLLRGYPVYMAPDYPMHINVPSVYECDRILSNIASYKRVETFYNNFGLVPKMNVTWQKICPLLRGQRFSDAFILRYLKS